MMHLLLDFVRRRWWHVSLAGVMGLIFGAVEAETRPIITFFFIMLPMGGVGLEAGTGHQRALLMAPVSGRTVGRALWCESVVLYAVLFVGALSLGSLAKPLFNPRASLSPPVTLNTVLLLSACSAVYFFALQRQPLWRHIKEQTFHRGFLDIVLVVGTGAFLLYLVYALAKAKTPISPWLTWTLPVALIGLSFLQAGRGMLLLPNVSARRQRRADKAGPKPSYNTWGFYWPWLSESRIGGYLVCAALAVGAATWLREHFGLLSEVPLRMILVGMTPALLILAPMRVYTWLVSLSALKMLPHSQRWLTAYLLSLLLVPAFCIAGISCIALWIFSSAAPVLAFVLILPAMACMVLLTSVLFLLYGQKGTVLGMMIVFFLFILCGSSLAWQLSQGYFLSPVMAASIMAGILAVALHLTLMHHNAAYHQKMPSPK